MTDQQTALAKGLSKLEFSASTIRKEINKRSTTSVTLEEVTEYLQSIGSIVKPRYNNEYEPIVVADKRLQTIQSDIEHLMDKGVNQHDIPEYLGMSNGKYLELRKQLFTKVRVTHDRV